MLTPERITELLRKLVNRVGADPDCPLDASAVRDIATVFRVELELDDKRRTLVDAVIADARIVSTDPRMALTHPCVDLRRVLRKLDDFDARCADTEPPEAP